jgi:hypothetical protein
VSELEQLRAGANIPDNGPPVVAGGQDPLAFRVKGEGAEATVVAAPHAPRDGAGRGVDQHGGGMGALAAKGQGPAIWGNRDRPDPADPGRERPPDLSGRSEFPEGDPVARRAVGGGDDRPVGADGHGEVGSTR